MAYSKALTQAIASTKAQIGLVRAAETELVARYVAVGKALIHIRALVNDELGYGKWGKFHITELGLSSPSVCKYINIAASKNPAAKLQTLTLAKNAAQKKLYHKKSKAMQTVFGVHVRDVELQKCFTVAEAVRQINAVLSGFGPRSRKRILAEVQNHEEGMTTKKAFATLKSQSGSTRKRLRS